MRCARVDTFVRCPEPLLNFGFSIEDFISNMAWKAINEKILGFRISEVRELGCEVCETSIAGFEIFSDLFKKV